MYQLSEYAYKARGNSLCSYLIALAAFQKGLEVKYLVNCSCIEPLTHNRGYGAEVYSISDGEKKFLFMRSRGSKTDQSAHWLTRNKYKTKKILKNAGIEVPKGITLPLIKAIENDSLFSKLGCQKLVTKPVNGSAGIGVTTNICSQLELNDALKKIDRKYVIIEEHLDGEEFRYYVVGDNVVAVTGRDAANVIGDGKSSIRALVKRKNRQRYSNPHLASRLIRISEKTISFLQKQGYSLDSVVDKGIKVYLTKVANLSMGGDSIDATHKVSEESKRVAVSAVRALGIPNAGVDIINTYHEGRENSWIIEINSQAHIGSHSFPMSGIGQGNNVAEHIIDTYFPDRKVIFRDVYFDIELVKKTLLSGALSEIALPVLSESFVKKKIKFHTNIAPETVFLRVEKTIRDAGCYGELHNFGGGNYILRLLVDSHKETQFVRKINSYLELGDTARVDISKTPMMASFKIIDHTKDYDNDQDPITVKLLIFGKVQGVSYRAWLARLSRKKSIDGWVRNLADGTVESLLCGNPSLVMEIVEECREGSKRSQVEHVISRRVIDRPSESGFKIL